MATKIKGILFDLGDTLLDFGKVNVAGLFRLGARLTYDYLRDLSQPLPSFAKYHRQQLRAFRWRTLKSRITNREFNALELVRQLTTRMGHHLTAEQMLDERNWQGACSHCHHMKTVHPDEARERGLAGKSWDFDDVILGAGDFGDVTSDP